MNRKVKVILFGLFVIFSLEAGAQTKCKIVNKQFQAGEEIVCDLYFKYGPIYTKAGSSSLSAASVKFEGKDAYKMTLRANTSGAVGKLFSLNDTLTSYTTKDLIPLKFVKKAHEGKDDTDESVTYSYPSTGGVSMHAKRIRNATERFNETITTQGCVYDMVSVVYYARTLDYSSMKKGDMSAVEFISGKKKVYMVIEHGGIETIQANDKKKYECIKLVMSITNGNKLAFDDKEEAMKVYISNDDNRMPVRLDSQLKVGSTRAILRSYKGNKHTVNSK